jgi:kinesin family protein 13
MEGPKTTLLCLEDSKKNKDFSFDYSFWSHDGFELNNEGKVRKIKKKFFF